MLKLNFKIDKKYLAAHAIARVWQNLESPFSSWTNLVYDIHKKNPEAINFLTNPSLVIMSNGLESAKKEAERVLRGILKTKEFKMMHKETEKYLKTVSEEWDKNKEKAINIIKDLSGVRIPDKKIDIYITHPKLSNGRVIPHKDAIVWGHKDEFKNYSTVYLCHELLHLLTQGAKDQNIIHVLITFISDKELRNELNKDNVSLKEAVPPSAPPFIKKQIQLNNKIAPYWKRYKNKKKYKDIFELENYLIKKIAE